MSEVVFQAPQSGDTIPREYTHLVAYDLPANTDLLCTAVPAAGTGLAHNSKTIDQHDFHTASFTLDPGTYTFRAFGDGGTSGGANNVEVVDGPRLVVTMSEPEIDPLFAQVHYTVTLTADLSTPVGIKIRKDTVSADTGLQIGTEPRLFTTLQHPVTTQTVSFDYDPESTVAIWHMVQVRYQYPDGGPTVTKVTRAAAPQGVLGSSPHSRTLSYRASAMKELFLALFAKDKAGR